MNLQKIIDAEKEAKEFIKRCKKAKDSAKADCYFFFGTRESGSLKRQSMELSSALVELRKSN